MLTSRGTEKMGITINLVNRLLPSYHIPFIKHSHSIALRDRGDLPCKTLILLTAFPWGWINNKPRARLSPFIQCAHAVRGCAKGVVPLDGRVEGVIDGMTEGVNDGMAEGMAVGEVLGDIEGTIVGKLVGVCEGITDGTIEGLVDGATVGGQVVS